MPYDTPEPFTVDIPEHALIDLDERLRRWRPTTAIADKGSWASGTDPEFLAGLVDIDASPAIAQSLQIPQVPLLMVILDGRPAAQPVPGVLKRDEIDTLLNQLAQGLTAQGITARHQPLPTAPQPGDEGEMSVKFPSVEPGSRPMRSSNQCEVRSQRAKMTFCLTRCPAKATPSWYGAWTASAALWVH